MEILKYYDTVFEAEVARGRLESEGITAVVQNETLGSVIPLGSATNSLRPYLAVADEDAVRAAEVLGIFDRQAPVCACPGCGSEDVVFRFFYKDKPVKAFVHYLFLPLLLASAYPGNIRRGYHCRKCGNWF